jgi:hypothetical protein
VRHFSALSPLISGKEQTMVFPGVRSITLLAIALLGACGGSGDGSMNSGALPAAADHAQDPGVAAPGPGAAETPSEPPPPAGEGLPDDNIGLEGEGAGTSPPNAGDGNEGEGTTTAGDCTSLPAVSDYGAPGPFADVRIFSNVGPGNNYTLFRAEATLGKGGFKHPLATWGNGITTTPDQYQTTLSLIATHGFVIIACNDTQAERPCLAAGLDWLVEQNDTAGTLQGKLDTSREVTIGYSWGGGAAIDTADRPNVKATVSLHGMPPRGASAFADMHSPLLLFTSTGDTFVSAQGYVTPNFEASQVQTFYATLNDTAAGHLYVVDAGAAVCIGGILGLGTCQTALAEQAPTIAWLRYWACGDEGAERFFFGGDCTLCSAPWATPRRKEFP